MGIFTGGQNRGQVFVCYLRTRGDYCTPVCEMSFLKEVWAASLTMLNGAGKWEGDTLPAKLSETPIFIWETLFHVSETDPDGIRHGYARDTFQMKWNVSEQCWNISVEYGYVSRHMDMFHRLMETFQAMNPAVSHIIGILFSISMKRFSM